MRTRNLIPVLLCAALCAPAVFAQRISRPGAPAAEPAPQKKTALLPPTGVSNFYTWEARPDDADGYSSANAPQPVCARVNGDAKVYIFTNYDYYPSVSVSNNSLAVRVGELSTPADTYQFLTSHSLPGRRQNFTTASITGTGDSTIYLFGGTNGFIEMNDVYSYTPAAGFNYVGLIPNLNFIQGNRSGAAAAPSKGLIYLFGGLQGSGVINQVLEFNPQTGQFAQVGTMPEGFYGARAMTKAVASPTPGVVGHYIYLVGGINTPGGAPNNKIYRFDVQNKTTQIVKHLSGAQLAIPPGSGYPTITWGPSGKIRIIAATNPAPNYTWGDMQAWVLNDNYPPSTNDGKATLIPSLYNDAARARDMAGAVKCGDATYLIGGTYGHGSTYWVRAKMVDRLFLPYLSL